MRDMIRAHGGRNYSIFLDSDTDTLVGYIEIENADLWAASARTDVCRRWWDYMAPLMAVNPDNSPVTHALEPVFHLN
jgi:L-rhamnose mutarotase